MSRCASVQATQASYETSTLNVTAKFVVTADCKASKHATPSVLLKELETLAVSQPEGCVTALRLASRFFSFLARSNCEAPAPLAA